MKRAGLADPTRQSAVRDLIRRALAEDLGPGDITTLALVPPAARAEAVIISRGDHVVSGTAVVQYVMRQVDRRVTCTVKIPDGSRVKAGGVIMALRGPAGSILTAERTALNFIQRMTGVATLTRTFVDRTATYGTMILDTRKTTPTLRVLEKYAVRCGGGTNHRMGLYDKALIKDNHRALWGRTGASDLAAAVRAVRKCFRGREVEVEVENEAELISALQARPEWILLDNMPPALMRRCVKRVAGACKLEASGGITLDNIVATAATGVDAISLGCLTHSARAADLSLEIV
jgi:nicotinate-nucleotide pyrophosphorylase (carboxylating)